MRRNFLILVHYLKLKGLKNLSITGCFFYNKNAATKILKDISKLKYLESLYIGFVEAKVDFSI